MPGSVEELLQEAAACAATDPMQLSIRELIGHWGAKRRGNLIVEEIQRDLATAGLFTVPDLADGWIDNIVELHGTSPASTASEPIVAPAPDFPEVPSAPVSLRVGNLASAHRDIIYVRLDDKLERAQALMMSRDYSQLAVLSGNRNLRGAISWESIAQAKTRHPKADLHEAIIPAKDVKVVREDEDLLGLIPTIVDAGFVFVRGPDETISGIVTTADLSEQFAALAGPFFMLAEIERRLRRVIDRHFGADVLAVVSRTPESDRDLASADALSMGQYIRLLEEPQRWAALGWSIERKIFIQELDAVRKIRNDVMHFSPDPLDDEQLTTMRTFLKFVRRLDPAP